MALRQAILADPPVSHNHNLKTMLREMLKIILAGNTFQFAGKTFKQLKGIAMGTSVAPTWANLFMGKLETAALNSWRGTPPLLWLRYIDDILTLFGNPTRRSATTSQCPTQHDQVHNIELSTQNGLP